MPPAQPGKSAFRGGAYQSSQVVSMHAPGCQRDESDRRERSELNHNRFLVFAEDMAHGVRDFADGAVALNGVDDARHEILSVAGSLFDAGDGRLPGGSVAAGAQGAEALELPALESRIDTLNLRRLVTLGLEAVDPDHDLLQAVDRLLEVIGGVLDFTLHVTKLDSAQRAAEMVDLGQVSVGARLDLVGERLDEIRAGQRVDGVGHPGLVADDLLSAQGNARRFFGRQAQGFVEGVGVQRLSSAEHSRQGLQRGAHDVVLRLLCGQRGAAVWVWKRSISERGFLAPKRSSRMRAHIRRAARYLATSSRRLLWALKKKERRGAKWSTSSPASMAACT